MSEGGTLVEVGWLAINKTRIHLLKRRRSNKKVHKIHEEKSNLRVLPKKNVTIWSPQFEHSDVGYFEDHPRTSKWLITLGSCCPLSMATFPFANGRASWFLNKGDPNYVSVREDVSSSRTWTSHPSPPFFSEILWWNSPLSTIAVPCNSATAWAPWRSRSPRCVFFYI